MREVPPLGRAAILCRTHDKHHAKQRDGDKFVRCVHYFDFPVTLAPHGPLVVSTRRGNCSPTWGPCLS
jgi:hypothetical protein